MVAVKDPAGVDLLDGDEAALPSLEDLGSIGNGLLI